MNDHDVKDFLTSASAVNPLGPIDSARLVERGRRGRRRRRLFAGTGGVAAVAAIAVGAALLPDLGTGRADPPVATPSTTSTPSTPTVHSKGFVRLPGVPDGDAALGTLASGDLLLHEAQARCDLRNPGITKRLGNALVGVGRPVLYGFDDPTEPVCIVPGDSRPLASTVVAAQADPVPATAAGMLRNCSVLMWHDLTSWRLVTSERLPGHQTNMLAISPSGQSVAMCSLKPGIYAKQDFNTSVGIFSTRTYWMTTLDHLADYGGQTCPEWGRSCVGWVSDNIGRVDPQIARIRITARNGKVHDVTTHDGWFALLWADGDPKGQPNAKVEAFDAKGNRVG